MKYLNLFFILIFIVFGLLQLNDPDPLFWLAIYLSGAILCFLAVQKSDPFWLYYLLISFYFVFSTYLFFAKDGVLEWITRHNMKSITGSMDDESPWIEQTREFFGLLILLFAAVINFLRRLKTTRQKSEIL